LICPTTTSAFHAVTAAQGKAAALLAGKIIGDAHESFFMERAVFPQHPVQITATQRGAVFGGGKRSLEPALHEDGADAVAHFPSRDTVADFHDFPRAVGTGHGGQTRIRMVEAPGKQQLAVIQRDGVNFDYDFMRGRFGRGSLNQREMLKAQLGIFVNFHIR
jgi:hypothetical protein